jgi:hypothetical protein
MNRAARAMAWISREIIATPAIDPALSPCASRNTVDRTAATAARSQNSSRNIPDFDPLLQWRRGVYPSRLDVPPLAGGSASAATTSRFHRIRSNAMRYRTVSILALACAGLSAVQPGFAHPNINETCDAGYWRPYTSLEVPADDMIAGYQEYLAYMEIVCAQITRCGIVDAEHYAAGVAEQECTDLGAQLRMTLRTVWTLPQPLKSAMESGDGSDVPAGLGVVCGRCDITVPHG